MCRYRNIKALLFHTPLYMRTSPVVNPCTLVKCLFNPLSLLETERGPTNYVKLWPKVLRLLPLVMAVLLSLLHSHTCFIYEANMRYI